MLPKGLRHVKTTVVVSAVDPVVVAADVALVDLVEDVAGTIVALHPPPATAPLLPQ